MRKLKSKIQILADMWKTIGILMFKEEKTQEEVDLLYICTEFFNSPAVSKFISLYEELSPAASESTEPLPVQNVYIPTTNTNTNTSSEEEGLALFTGMAVGGVLPVLGVTDNNIDTDLENSQLAEFHKLMEGI